MSIISSESFGRGLNVARLPLQRILLQEVLYILDALVEVGGKQYNAAVGDTLKLEKINKEPGTEVELNVLMTVDGENVVCGKDAEALKAKATVVAHGKDRKIIVFKYKAKKNERKKKGHRQQFTTVKVSAIG